MNWLAVCVIVFIVLCTMAGAKRGFIKTVLSFVSVLLAIMITSFIKEPVGDIIREKTGIYTSIGDSIEGYVDDKVSELHAGGQGTAESVIENLGLPQVLTDALKEGLTDTRAQAQSGIQSAAKQAAAWLTEMVFQAICYAISFVVVWLLLEVLSVLLQGIVTLPVLHQIDCMTGAVTGLVLSLAAVWIGGIAITACAATKWGAAALLMIEESPLLSFLYNNNYLLKSAVKLF